MVKKTEQANIILNGRAALCAGRDDMSSEEEAYDSNATENHHRFAKPDHFKTILESGEIPDAAMIHEARKKRQKARELGKLTDNFITFTLKGLLVMKTVH